MDPGNTHPFRAINCGAMAPQMFGTALVDLSQTGTTAPLCLDEIGETSADTQLFLLRALEERMTRLQGPNSPETSLRVLSLINRVMLDEVEAGRFRRDLFYRLSAITLTIPPLRDRGDDALLIAEHCNRKISIVTGRELLVLGPRFRAPCWRAVGPALSVNCATCCWGCIVLPSRGPSRLPICLTKSPHPKADRLPAN